MNHRNASEVSKVDREFICVCFASSHPPPSSIIYPSHQAANYQLLLKREIRNKKAIAVKRTNTIGALKPRPKLFQLLLSHKTFRHVQEPIQCPTQRIERRIGREIEILPVFESAQGQILISCHGRRR
jgi:hypothetical protein